MPVFSNLSKHFAANPRRLFLLDAIGAFITAGLLGLVLPNLHPYVGMPVTVLYGLAALACGFGIYSICCSLMLKAGFGPYLLLIALANSAYCCLTLGLICYYYKVLTVLGISYFLLEIAIIIVLILIELRVIQRLRKSDYTR